MFKGFKMKKIKTTKKLFKMEYKADFLLEKAINDIIYNHNYTVHRNQEQFIIFTFN